MILKAVQVDINRSNNDKATQKNVCAQLKRKNKKTKHKKHEGSCLVIVCDTFTNKMCAIYAIPA